ncbi:MAG: hypothetical protein DRR16_21830 [Candidatus Parabeggiatoa sp. nov. 3]|nr:MAG: hypothetical protein DRR00_00170 [Gammaproteobacteria bacterium]RKZ69569.1 MAG: hypothetical protein DRQ99_00615 [Gammaproteobacteria bacterium]RKZ81578.1 MAG: hypothetical protein DRR16_21830 [Gammaproteobacteria bacterium]
MNSNLFGYERFIKEKNNFSRKSFARKTFAEKECKIYFAVNLRSKFILRLLECLLFCEGLIEIMTLFLGMRPSSCHLHQYLNENG